jgi:hypothetical protein
VGTGPPGCTQNAEYATISFLLWNSIPAPVFHLGRPSKIEYSNRKYSFMIRKNLEEGH